MEPIFISDLFEELDNLLLDCLRSLTKEDWNRPTVARHWKVKDIVAHLLDGNIRTLSMSRDAFFGEKPPPIDNYQDLVGWLNQLNADWIKAFARVSPAVLIELLSYTNPQVSSHYRKLDPFGPAVFSVAWAGEQSSQNWFHIAREYTEKWHHQAQIREAVGALQPLLEQKYYLPFLETIIRGLPFQYRNQQAEEGTVIKISIREVESATWFLIKNPATWRLSKMKTNAVAGIEIHPAIAWKLFTKAIRPEDVLIQDPETIKIQGNPNLVKKALNLVAVMA
ncbi:hypothetical protein GCM10027036_02280 [Flavihumibacter cheonanensis]|uniref:maleylpyruvate isomerase N-terminal domain-containing protein n=1 Tax=Flavihumibacter cheonanensis TaxID=1442385 RepID=UPI001EF8C7E1|nr:maleylpyruvate isomerase N-terminal domain-containing protein [Flavihumibacter cheonanensis]MCG7752324.1 maleylpyruvate isomerase N-terminal domain-containing protein [Flavihumibacter cheonanensis]